MLFRIERQVLGCAVLVLLAAYGCRSGNTSPADTGGEWISADGDSNPDDSTWPSDEDRQTVDDAPGTDDSDWGPEDQTNLDALTKQWNELIDKLDASGNLIIAEGFDTPITKGAIRRVTDHPCDALSVVDMYEGLKTGDVKKICAPHNLNRGEWNFAGQTGPTYRGIAVAATGTSQLTNIPLDPWSLSPSEETAPFADGMRWAHSPQPDPVVKAAGTHGLRWTYSQYYAVAAGYARNWPAEAGYNYPYSAASAGSYYIAAFCNNWERDCPNNFSLKHTRDLWLRLSYYFGPNTFQLPEDVPQWVIDWCASHPAECPNGVHPQDFFPMMIHSEDDYDSSAVNPYHGQWKGIRWFGSHGDTCRDKHLSGQLWDRDYYPPPSAADKYSCKQGSTPSAPGGGFQVFSFHPHVYYGPGEWNDQNQPFWASSERHSADDWPDFDKDVFYSRYGDASYHFAPSRPKLRATGVKTVNQGWTFTFDGPFPWWLDLRVGDAAPFVLKSCTGFPECPTDKWFNSSYVPEIITGIDESNPNAPVITTTGKKEPTWSGSAVVEFAFPCSIRNFADENRNPLRPLHAPGCEQLEGGKWYTFMMHIRFLDDTTHEPMGCDIYNSTAENCTSDRFGNPVDPRANVEAPAILQIWMKKQGESPVLLVDRPFRMTYPYWTLSAQGMEGPEATYNEPGDPPFPQKVLGGFRIDHERFYQIPARFWNGVAKSGYTRPNDGIYITVDNLLLVKNLPANWAETEDAWKGAP